jgi:hypothetical protein
LDNDGCKTDENGVDEMTHVQISASTTAQRLRQLAQLYQQGQASELMDRTLDKLLTYEADLCQLQLRGLQNDLAAFEQQYGLSSKEFYRRFQTGQTDDEMDYVEWASLIQMANNLRERIRLLTSENQT